MNIIAIVFVCLETNFVGIFFSFLAFFELEILFVFAILVLGLDVLI